MNKTIICSIPMRNDVKPSIYKSDDRSVPSSDHAVKYPINAFLEATLVKGTKLKVILLAKSGVHSAAEQNIRDFQTELGAIAGRKEAAVEYIVLDTKFAEEKSIHEQLMGTIVDNIDAESHIVADITYGPKDLPIVMFSALNFAEKFLYCDIDNILYGLAEFSDDGVVNTRLCDMSSLFYLSSVTNTIHANSPDKAKQMLKTLLSF